MSLIYPPVPTSPARTSLAPDTPSPLEDTHQADGGDGGDAGAAAALLEKAQVPPHLNITVRRRTPAVKTPGTTPESPLVAFVERAEKVLEHEARDALLTPPGSRAGSVVGDDDSADDGWAGSGGGGHSSGHQTGGHGSGCPVGDGQDYDAGCARSDNGSNT